MRKIIVFAFLMPVITYAVSFYGGYQYLFAPKDNITSELGLFVGVEHEIGPISINGGYRYVDFDLDRLENIFWPETQPVYGWKCHTIRAGGKYPILRRRVSPYVTGDIGVVWYRYTSWFDTPIPRQWGEEPAPDPNAGPAFAFSVSAGAETSIWGPFAFFGEFGYERHFIRILNTYDTLTRKYRYMDIEYWGLGISAGLTIDVL